jgi:uncharacterized protein YcnI
MRKEPHVKRLVIPIAAAAVAAVAVPSAGSHATVSLLQPQGRALTAASVTYILRVPNEKAAQSTYSVIMTVPEAVQRSISVKQSGDWTITLQRRDTGEKNANGEPIMATQKVTWRAKPGNVIRPGFYGEFQFRLRNPATPTRMCFATDQWYNAKQRGGKSELVSWSGPSDSATPASCIDVVAS